MLYDEYERALKRRAKDREHRVSECEERTTPLHRLRKIGYHCRVVPIRRVSASISYTVIQLHSHASTQSIEKDS